MYYDKSENCLIIVSCPPLSRRTPANAKSWDSKTWLSDNGPLVQYQE